MAPVAWGTCAPARLGWICPRCGASLSPDALDCAACAPPPFRPVPPGAPPDSPVAVPCPPSREGAMCRCGEDEETPRWHALTELLDAMAEAGAFAHRRTGPAWSEALPGVEFRMAGGATTEALVEFRARPREDA